MPMNEGAPIIIKKKRKHDHGHHGGAWKVAYADFVTAMMAFFLVMWIMGLSDGERASVQGYFNDPMGFMKSTPKGRINLGYAGARERNAEQGSGSALQFDAERDRRQLEQVKQDLDQFVQQQGGQAGALSALMKNVEIRLTDEGLEVEFIEGKGVAYFELGSSNITSSARRIIGEVAPFLKKAGRVFFVDGHTDARNYAGGGYDNFDLSADRAQAVKRALVVSGVPNQQVLGVRAFASSRLRNRSNPLADENRRVTLVMPFRRAELNQSAEALPNNPVQDSAEEMRGKISLPQAPRMGQ